MTNPFFPFLRMLLGDSYLQEFSCSQEDLLADLIHKKVAIIGNARSLSEKSYGAAIDACDVVVRMHAAPLPQKNSHGSKTHWLALGMPIAQNVIDDRAPERLLWMAKKRKRVKHCLALHKGFYLHPVDDWEKLAGLLNAPPTTGAMIIDLAARSSADEIQLFGFDFFASLSLSGRRNAQQVPHDFEAEKKYVETLMTNDSRVVLNT